MYDSEYNIKFISWCNYMRISIRYWFERKLGSKRVIKYSVSKVFQEALKFSAKNKKKGSKITVISKRFGR